MRRLLFGFAAAALAVALLALSGAAFGHSPRALLAILVSGSIGSRFAFEGTLLLSGFAAAALALSGAAFGRRAPLAMLISGSVEEACTRMAGLA